MTVKRQCADWLQTFYEWTSSKGESPNQYIFWTGLFAIASALKRKVIIPRRLLGGWDLYPNLFVFLVGPPGLRKTTTMDYMDEIYEEIPEIVRAPQSATQESIMAMLVAQNDSSLTIISKEFGNLYKSSTTKLIEFLVASYDGNKVFDNLTLSRGHELIYNPSVNLLAATTPAWIAENFTPAMLSGGFASRIIWVYEQELRRFQLFYPGLDAAGLDAQRKRLVHDLNHIANNIEGEVDLEEDVMDYMEDWYQNFMRKVAPTMDSRIQGYIQRKTRHALTVSLLLSISRQDELKITKRDFDKALKILEGIEARLPTVFSSVGKNEYTLDMEEIINYVRMKQVVEKKQLVARFSHIAKPDVLVSLLASLCVVFERLEYIPEKDSYKLREEKNG